MFKKKPILLLISISFLLIYSLFEIGYFVYSEWSNDVPYSFYRQEKIINYLEIGKILLNEDKVEVLTTQLNRGIANDEIDFFVIRQGSNIFSFGERNNNPKITLLDYVENQFGRLNESDLKVFYGNITSNNYNLVVGIHSSIQDYFVYMWNEKKGRILIVILTLTLVIFLIVKFFFNDILGILATLREPNRKNLSKLHPLSLESELFLKGFSGYENALGELSTRYKMLEDQLLPSLKSELMSGKKPPYEFNCTLVRTDINNFSHIFNNYPVNEFMDIINEFFIDASHIISRYGGYVHEFVGDEVIFYFKDENHTNSKAIALSAIIDINQSAARLNQITRNKHGYPFVVKSSLAHGNLLYSLQVKNFSLAGSILIETVRILSKIQEKEVNTIFYDEKLSNSLVNIFQSRKEEIVSLKGIPKPVQLYSLSSKDSLSKILNQPATAHNEHLDFLIYYRSDDDLILTLNYLEKNIETLDKSAYLKIISAFKHFMLSHTSPTIVDSYLKLLRLTQHYAEVKRDDKYGFYLSSLVMSSINLIARESYSSEIDLLLKSLLHSSEPRVVANVIDVISWFDPNQKDDLFTELLNHANNRILANAIIKEGMTTLEGRVIRVLKRMFEIGNPFFTASALFAIGELNKYHKKTNPVYLSTSLHFLKLSEDTIKYKDHPEEMVRRQANIAMQKISSN